MAKGIKHWRENMRTQLLLAVSMVYVFAFCSPAEAGIYRFQLFGEELEAISNNSLTAGVQFRIESRSNDLVGKSNINPDVCQGIFQLCQGVVREQDYPAARLRDAPGQGSMNFDDGNLNYDKGDVTQAPFVLNNDVKLRWRDYELFVRGRGVYDPVNYNFTETHPNKVTPENFESVLTRGDPFANRYFPATLGRGALVRQERSDEIADEFRFYDLLDVHLTKPVDVAGQEVVFRLGRQVVNWGESTVTILNSLSQANPVNANNIFRLGNALLEDLYVPVNMISMSTAFSTNLAFTAFYQLEWQPVDIPPPGSFMSFIDLGVNNLGEDVLNASFGSAPDDFDKLGRRLANPLGLVARTTLTIGRERDDEPDSAGQYGFSLEYYAEDLNNGTQFGAYFMNYHSRLPYVDVYSANASCMRAAGNPQNRDALNTFEILTLCPNLSLTEYTPGVVQAVVDFASVLAQRPALLGQIGVDGTPLDAVTGVANLLVFQPGRPLSEIVPFDSAKVQLTYPEDIQLFGLSFNTTFGQYALQGEVAYRPNLPLQVSVVDLGFAAQGTTLASCTPDTVRCAGTAAALSFGENSTGNQTVTGQNTTGQVIVYDNGNFVDANGETPYQDTVFLLLAGVPNAARSFPNFIIPYRGGTLGENPPNSRIKGYIRSNALQYTLGATRLYGASENWIGADQVLFAYEAAAMHVLDFPDFDKLQIEGPLTAYTHASAGAEGSGADGSRLACSTNPACTVGPDGIRFNPYQASRHSFANAFSGGYRIVSRILYESVLPSISIAPLFLWQHDIIGNSPAPNFNFVEGRYSLTSILEFRYEKAMSVSIVYNLFGGAGRNNLLADRDNLGFFVKYQF